MCKRQGGGARGSPRTPEGIEGGALATLGIGERHSTLRHRRMLRSESDPVWGNCHPFPSGERFSSGLNFLDPGGNASRIDG
jgi:hypothetical protein